MNNWIVSEPFMSDDGFVFIKMECPRCGWTINREGFSKDDIGHWHYCPMCGKHNYKIEFMEETNA